MEKHAFTIYDASAGSGKTYTLVKEYLKIILKSSRDDAYKNILAITFTNKAVKEMKSRIVDSLSAFALPEHERNPKMNELLETIAQEIHRSSQDLHAKSKRIVKTLIHNYASFDISTIDKFTHRVIRTFAHDLNLPTTFEVSLETDRLLQEAVESIIAQAGEDEVLTQLLIDFTMEKTDDDKSWDVTQDFMNISKLLVNENNRNEISVFKETSIAQFVAVKQKMKETLRRLEEELQTQGVRSFQLIQSRGLSDSSFNRKTVYQYFKNLSEGVFELKETVSNYLEEGNRYAKSVPQSEKDAVDEIAPILAENYLKVKTLMEKLLFHDAFLKNITPLSLLSTIDQTLSKIQEEQNVLSISEFNAIIYEEIQNQPAPFIYERMGERYRHFFIDEFQDTSEMQWENLIPLIDNALASEEHSGERGSLMIVGDPKQSIYRWRGGKAEQFIALGKDKNPFVNPDKKTYHLDTNYRSYTEVIHFNNDFFKFLSASFDHLDYQELYRDFSGQKVNDKVGGFVSLEFIPNTTSDEQDEDWNKTEAYLEKMNEIIQDVLLQGFTFGEIVILTRKKEQGVAVAHFLTQQNIPILSSETLLIENSTDVQVLIYLLKFLNNGADDESKAHFLYFLSKRLDTKLPSHDFILQGLSCSSEKELEQWLQQFDISISFQNIRKKALYEATEILISKFIRPEKSDAYLQFFLDIVLERELRSQAGVTDFLEFWTQNGHKFSIPSPESSHAIRIMTIHKSKGLEFPVVIFPFAEERYNNTPKDKIWLNTSVEEVGLSKALVNNTQSVVKFGDAAAEIYQQKKQEELLDNINILYVAMTRSEEQLYVISSMNINAKEEIVKNNMSTFFLEFINAKQLFNPQKLTYHFGNKKKISKVIEMTSQVKPIHLLTSTLPVDAIRIAQREALMWGTHQEEAIEFGNILHEIMASIHNLQEVNESLDIAIETGLIALNQKEIFAKMIHELVQHPELYSFFDSEHQSWNEQTLLRPYGKPLKPDRIVEVAPKVMWILDYKTGKPSKKHQIQVNEYAQVLQDMGYYVQRKTLVYLGSKLNLVEVNDAMN